MYAGSGGQQQQSQVAPTQHVINQQQQSRPVPPRPVQVRPAGQGRPPPQRLVTPAGGKNMLVVGGKGTVAGLGSSRPSAKEKGEFIS